MPVLNLKALLPGTQIRRPLSGRACENTHGIGYITPHHTHTNSVINLWVGVEGVAPKPTLRLEKAGRRAGRKAGRKAGRHALLQFPSTNVHNYKDLHIFVLTKSLRHSPVC